VGVPESINTRTSEAVIYSLKGAVSAMLAVAASEAAGLPGGSWAAVSAVIVTQPSLHPSVRASWMRVLANLVAAIVAAGVVTGFGHGTIALGLGVLVTGILCYCTRIEEAVRSAYAAVVILIIAPGNAGILGGPLGRVLGVMLGCAAALVVGWVFDRLSGTLSAPGGERQPSHDPGE